MEDYWKVWRTSHDWGLGLDSYLQSGGTSFNFISLSSSKCQVITLLRHSTLAHLHNVLMFSWSESSGVGNLKGRIVGEAPWTSILWHITTTPLPLPWYSVDQAIEDNLNNSICFSLMTWWYWLRPLMWQKKEQKIVSNDTPGSHTPFKIKNAWNYVPSWFDALISHCISLLGAQGVGC